MIGQTERDDKGVEAQFMKKKILVLLVCSMLTLSTTVSADILDYEGTINAYKEDNKIPQTFEIDDGSGEKVTAVAKSDKVSVSAKATYIRSMPGKNGKKLVRVYLGTGVERVAVCDNGWSKVTYVLNILKGDLLMRKRAKRVRKRSVAMCPQNISMTVIRLLRQRELLQH